MTDRSDRPRLSRLRREQRRRRQQCCDRLIVAFLIGFTLMLLVPQQARPAEAWDVKELLARYNCKWVAEMRRTHTDEELRQRAKELRLPQVVVRMAERCPK